MRHEYECGVDVSQILASLNVPFLPIPEDEEYQKKCEATTVRSRYGIMPGSFFFFLLGLGG